VQTAPLGVTSSDDDDQSGSHETHGSSPHGAHVRRGTGLDANDVKRPEQYGRSPHDHRNLATTRRARGASPLPRRADGLRRRNGFTVSEQPTGLHRPPRRTGAVRSDSTYLGTSVSPMSKRTVKRKLRTKKKANHGKKPNCGRG
jgi:hypothetical protein